MKKYLTMMLALLMVLSLGAAAFADTWGYLEWDEEHQMYEITLRDDGNDDDMDIYGHISYEDYLN